MKLKASLHIHTREDKMDGHMIDYDIYQLIDEAERHGFDVLGFTPHQKFVFRPQFAEYAKKRGIILIPGVEKSLGSFLHSHVIILNCGKSIEKVKNFKQLIKYKKEHPEVFIIAPHPTHSRILSIGSKKLQKYIDLFDAIEYSWMYSKGYNSNLKAAAIALLNHKPLISTADVHVLKRLDTDFAVIDTEDFSVESILDAIRHNKFENVTKPKRFLRDIVKYLIAINTKYVYRYIEIKILGLKARRLEPAKEKVR